MATNEVLIEEATGLAAELGISITTEGMTNAQLQGLVSDLKAKKKDADNVTQADNPPAEDPPAEDPPAEDPPAEDPPAEDPPAEDPPAEDPPAEDPYDGDPQAASMAARATAKEARDAAEQAALDRLPVRKAKGSKYFVEPGRSITTPVGVLSDNQEIPGKVVKMIGEKGLDLHVKSGVLYRGELAE